MEAAHALHLLGLPDNPATAQVKDAYRKKVLECHPDRVPPNHKAEAEAHFRLVNEAYRCLLRNGGRGPSPAYSARTSVARRRPGQIAVAIPYLLMVTGTLSFGAVVATRKYLKCETARASHPFLP